MLTAIKNSPAWSVMQRPVSGSKRLIGGARAAMTVITLSLMGWGLIASHWQLVSVALLLALLYVTAAATLAERALSDLSGEGTAEEERTSDLSTYADLVELVPSRSGALRVLEFRPWATSYEPDDLGPLREFGELWDSPERSFFSDTLQSLKRDCLESVSEFREILAGHVFMRDGRDDFRIYPDVDIDVWGPENQWVRDALDEINAAADEVVSKHKQLIEAARQELHPA